jgi:Zn-dependent metalloprotease
MTRISVAVLLTLSVLAAMVLPAGALTQANQNELYEIRLPAFDLQGQESYGRDMGVLETRHSLEARYGGQWSVYAWNPLSNTPRHLYGNAVQMSSGLRGAGAVESLARRVISDNADVLKADNANLRLHATPHALGKWVAHFQQTHGGIDVWEARVRVAFSDSGKLLLMGSDYYENIDLNTTPSLPAGTAIAIATGALPYDPATDRVETQPELLVLPVPVSESAVEHHLVWRLKVRTANPLGAWVTHVDAHSGDIVWRYNDIHFDYAGGTEGDTQVYGVCDGVSVTPVPYLNLTVSGAGGDVTDANGDWSVTGGGATATVAATLYGPYIYIDNFNGDNADFSGVAMAEQPFTLAWDDGNSRQDERDVFSAINQVHDFFNLFDAEFGYSNDRMHGYVNRDDGYCPGNAWWDGNINFCAAGGQYNNTGELQQVVHHEFGHGVQAYILGYQGGEGLGEGNGDIIGNLITQDPIIGRGFYVSNCTSGIRNSDNNLQYPGDVVGQEIHYAGQVIAGFNWDSMELLQALYGGGASWDSPGTILSAERWHFGRQLMLPTTQPDQVFATFFADDDNADMSDGTPHHEIFCEAADNHGFDCPEVIFGVIFEHDPLGDTTDDLNPYLAQTTILSTEGIIDPSTVKLRYRVDGSLWTELAMSHDGGDAFSASIPAQGVGSQVEYYLYAEDLDGLTGTEPGDAPLATHSFFVAWLIDPLELPEGWTVDPDGTDGAFYTGVWEHVDPVGSGYQPDDDHTGGGTHCWVTGQHTEGDSDSADDVDFGRTTLLSPVYDLTGATSASFRYWKWFASNSSNDEFDLWLSNDDGGSWIRVEHNPNSTNGWENVAHDLGDHFAAPGLLRLKFTAEDYGAANTIEAAVDDISILADFDDLTAVDEGVTVEFVTGLAQNSPNPFNPTTKISFSLAEAGPVRLAVYDARGRLVRELAKGAMAAGEQTVLWDGRDTAGQALASGIYLYRLETDAGVIAKRMTLLK